MKLGMIGLGKMGGNMTERLLGGGHEVVVFDLNAEVARKVGSAPGAAAAASLEDVVARLAAPRIVWTMVPAGDPTEATLRALAEKMEPGDVLIDGGNSMYRDTMRRGKELAEKGIHFLDAGTSGGVWGLEVGYCLMVGGPEEAARLCEPIFRTLAPPDGYLHVGPSGSGHFVKMVHNGIEYGLLQAYAEGFEILHASDFPLDLPAISTLWNQGSVVRSWLLDLLIKALEETPDLDGIASVAADSGEGRWTVTEAVANGVAAPVISAALFARFTSQHREDDRAMKVVSALRHQFGGHAIELAPPAGEEH